MNETVIEIMARMTAAKFRHVPVVEEAGSPASCRSATW